MAIDNDTSYELTGAQIKDLAQKIRNKADDNTFVGASSLITGSKGLVPAPQAGDDTKFLSGDGTWKALASIFYPVGSIYMSATLSTAAQVEAAIGGTWVAWGAGRVPVGVDTSDADFDTAEETGGSKYLQQHSHNTVNWAAGYQTGSQSNFFTVLCGDSSSYVKQAVANAGTGDSGNLQPYITCYMYKRTA